MWLIEKTKLPVIGTSSKKDFQIMLPSEKTNDQPSKTQSQDILSYNLYNAEKTQQPLTTMVRDRAVYELTRLKTIERNYQGLKASIKQSRNKRGLVDGGGKILNWLFGLSSTEELDKVKKTISRQTIHRDDGHCPRPRDLYNTDQFYQQGQFQKGYPPTIDYKDHPTPPRPKTTQTTTTTTTDHHTRRYIDTAHRISHGLHQQPSARIDNRHGTNGPWYQMDGLSDLEHARFNIDNTQTYSRYPWEWIGILILYMFGTGVAIAADRTKTANRQQKIVAQIQALEHRLLLHEQTTSSDETE
ncbi:Uncharacterized protein APZ42_031494 [Daphnia magna]|uniref:Uncharacterized protein n=1 Tax=Daphnia magna TaxID=35525 RepID=A0A164MTJ0_9CRUS|nr:Uncharacterized protein APZ42_031494 [Daphnia magna]